MIFGLLSYTGPDRPLRLITSPAMLESAFLASSEEGMVRVRPRNCSVARKNRMRMEVLHLWKKVRFNFFLSPYVTWSTRGGKKESRHCEELRGT